MAYIGLIPCEMLYNTGQLLLFVLSKNEEISGLILGLRPANGRRRYKVTPSLIGWTQT